MNELDEGYYWVKIFNEWTIGEYHGDVWGWVFMDYYDDTPIDEIGEKIERKN